MLVTQFWSHKHFALCNPYLISVMFMLSFSQCHQLLDHASLHQTKFHQ